MHFKSFNHREILRFKHFSNKGYALFAVLGREVLVGTLSVATLTYAKADGISTRTDLVNDSLTFASVKLDEVQVTGSRAPLTAQQSARVVGVITREEIHRSGASTINDLLKLTSAVDVRQRGGFGVQTDISINGGTFDQMTLLLNGVDISNPQTGHNAAFFPVALADIDHIEILEGASSRVFGTQAFNGAINIVTRKKVSDQGAVVNVEGGSFGSFGAQGTVKLGNELGGKVPFSMLYSGGYHRSDGGTDNSDFERSHGFLQADADLTRNFSMDLQLGINHQNYGANTFYSAKYNNQYENANNFTSAISASLHGADRKWEVKPLFYYNRFLDHYQLIRGVEGASAGENYHDLDVYGGGVNAYLNWLLGKTALGVDIRKERIYSTAYGEELDEDHYKDIDGSDRQYTRRGERTNTNLYLEHNIIWQGLTISAGFLANKNTCLDQDFRLYPGVDVSYRFNDAWKVFASWNKALRVPTYTDLYTSNVAQQGDVNLKPEKKSEWRAGLTYQTPFVDARLSGFYSKGKNMIDWVYETEESTRYHALNIGKLDNMGVSLDAAFNLSNVMANSFLKRVRVGYSYIHQKHETDEEIFKSLYALEYLRHKFTLGVDHQIWSRLSAKWDLRWQQRMNGYHPYWKLDGKLMWEDKYFDAYVMADNLTCHRYYDYGAVLQPGLWMMAGANIKLSF
jgi:vitamin B12 transporter